MKTVTLNLSERALENLKFLLSEWINYDEIKDIVDNTIEDDCDNDKYETIINEWCEDLESINKQL